MSLSIIDTVWTTIASADLLRTELPLATSPGSKAIIDLYVDSNSLVQLKNDEEVVNYATYETVLKSSTGQVWYKNTTPPNDKMRRATWSCQQLPAGMSLLTTHYPVPEVNVLDATNVFLNNGKTLIVSSAQSGVLLTAEAFDPKGRYILDVVISDLSECIWVAVKRGTMITDSQIFFPGDKMRRMMVTVEGKATESITVVTEPIVFSGTPSIAYPAPYAPVV